MKVLLSSDEYGTIYIGDKTQKIIGNPRGKITILGIVEISDTPIEGMISNCITYSNQIDEDSVVTNISHMYDPYTDICDDKSIIFYTSKTPTSIPLTFYTDGRRISTDDPIFRYTIYIFPITDTVEKYYQSVGNEQSVFPIILILIIILFCI
jgi:hypothetical protein